MSPTQKYIKEGEKFPTRKLEEFATEIKNHHKRRHKHHEGETPSASPSHGTKEL